MKNKGITLVALVVTIIIMLILAGVTLRLTLGDNGLIKKAKETTEGYEDVATEEDEALRSFEKDLENLKAERNEENKKGINKPKVSDGMIPIKYDEEKKNWVITNEEDEEWYDYKTFKWANVMLSDGKYKESEKDNINSQASYKDDGTTVVAEADLGSMFVWIPRYAYSINKYQTESNLAEGTTQNITKVEFIKGTGNRGFNGITYGTSYDEDKVTVGSPTPMIVHPAFTFGGKSLSGIWVAKFEASMAETNLNTEANNDVSIGKTVKVLPNKDTWRYINIGNIFINCYNMNTNSDIYGIRASQVDSHMMKNIEWGAVAYLSASQYGVVPTINTATSLELGIYHEYSGGSKAEGSYKLNVKQSTTGNVTGIYDMCGGNWEYVAAYYDNRDAYLNDYGTGAFERNNTLKTEYTKYWDKYEVGNDEKTIYGPDRSRLWDKTSSENATRMKITKERHEKMKNHNGDAMHEVIGIGYSYFGKKTNEDYDWILIANTSSGSFQGGTGYYNDDYALIGNCALPFVLHGGDWSNGTNAGIFALNDYNGGPSYSDGFRPVLVV